MHLILLYVFIGTSTILNVQIVLLDDFRFVDSRVNYSP